MYQKKSIASSMMLCVALTTLFMTTGCKKDVAPKTMPVSGTIMLRGKPLPNVEVKFIPMLEVDGSFVATGISDDEGKFTLKLRGSQDPGSSCCVGEHKITVKEGPMPEGARGQDEASQQIAIRHERTLKNRPIPAGYSAVSSLTVVVTEDKSEYLIEID